jgi:hypothetical protein
MSLEIYVSRRTKALFALGAIMVSASAADIYFRVQPKIDEIQGLALSIAPPPTQEEKRTVEELRHLQEVSKQPLMTETSEYIQSVDERQKLYDDVVADLTPDEYRTEEKYAVTGGLIGVGILLSTFLSLADDLTNERKPKKVIFKCGAHTRGACTLREGFIIESGVCSRTLFPDREEGLQIPRCVAKVRVPPRVGETSDDALQRLLKEKKSP